MNFQQEPALIPVHFGSDHRFSVSLRREVATSAARSVRFAGLAAGCQKPHLGRRASSRSLWVSSELLLTALTLGICLKPATFAQTPQPQAPAGRSETFTPAAAGAAAAEHGTNGICLNFHGARANLVLEYLSDAGGFVINLEAEVRDAIDVWTNGPVTKDQAVELLNSSLNQHGYAVTLRGRILTVVNLDRAKTADLEIVTGNDPDTVQKSDEMVTQIIPVRYANVGQLVNNLGPLLPARASLSVNESANALVLVSSRTDVRRMLKIISALDAAIARVSSIKVFPLNYADATELATVVQQLFASGATDQSVGGRNTAPQFFNPPGSDGFSPPGSLQMPGAPASSKETGATAVGAKVVAVADERSNCLIVCTSAGLIPALTEVVRRLDRQVNDTTQLRVFRLRNAEPDEVAEQLSQLFPDDTTGGSAPDQAGFSLGGPPPPGSDLPNATSATAQSDSSERRKKQGRVLTVADARTSSLLVSAATTLMPQIAELIQRLDADPGRNEAVNFWDLSNADPQDVKQVLQVLFNRNNAAPNNDNNNPLLGQNNPLTVRQTQQQSSTTTGSLKPGNSGMSGAAGSAGGF
jgi:type II secretory pathway component GspD/PulD (secretin)